MTSVESVKVVVSIGFSVGMVPNLGVFPCLVDLGNLLVERRLGVEVVPEHFSVLRVITTSEVLLRTVVNEWDSSAGHRENDRTGEGNMVTIAVQEASVVVIVNKYSKSIDVFEFSILLVVSVSDVLHALVVPEHVLDSVVHGVIEQSGQVVGVRTNIGGVSIEALTHLEDSRRISVLLPEVFRDLRDGVNSNSVKIVILDCLLDPVLQVASDVTILLGKIREAS